MGGFSGSANGEIIVDKDSTQVVLTGTGANTSETILKTVTLPPLGLNSIIDIDSLFSWTSSANTKTIRVRLGGIGGQLVGSFASTTNLTQQLKTIIRNVNSVSTQKSFSVTSTSGFGTSTNAVVSGAINTGVSTTLVFTGQLDAAAAAAGDSIRYEASTVKVVI